VRRVPFVYEAIFFVFYSLRGWLLYLVKELFRDVLSLYLEAEMEFLKDYLFGGMIVKKRPLLGLIAIVGLTVCNLQAMSFAPDPGPLHWACVEGNAAEVARLLDEGVQLRGGACALGGGLLHLTARNLSPQTTKMLLERGFSARETDKKGNMPLHVVARAGYPSVAAALLDHDPSLLEERNNNSKAPIHRAACSGNVEVMEELIKRGSNVNLKDRWGESVIEMAVCKEKAAAVRLLINAAADTMVSTALGARTSWSILHHAVLCCDNGGVMNVLLERATRNQLEAKTHQGETALHLAANFGRTEPLRLLLAQKANLEARDEEGRTPLFPAVEGHMDSFTGADYLGVIQMLIRKGADARARDTRGNTPLHRAVCDSRCVAVINMLTDSGADIHEVNDKGETPLHYAVQNLSPDRAAIGTLLGMGAKPMAEDNDGKTPLGIFEQRNAIYQQRASCLHEKPEWTRILEMLRCACSQ